MLLILRRHLKSTRFAPLLTSAFSRQRHMTSSITVPYVFPSDWQTVVDYQAVPSETEILKRDAYVPGYHVQDEDLTGVNMAALAYVASHVLSASEIPTVAFENRGSFNILFRLEFARDGRKLLARVPLKDSGRVSRIESCVATMSFAHHVRDIPSPKVFAWNASHDNAVGVPFIIQEYVDNAIEPWQVWSAATDEVHSRIFDELARCHAALLLPLPPPLHGVGDLVFAPGLSATSPLSDPRSYIVRPLQLRSPRPFLASSVSLAHLWDELWSYQNQLYIPDSDSLVSRSLCFDDDEQYDTVTFMTTSSRVRTFAENALRVLAQYPSYGQPCLVNDDYAYRNILIDPHTSRVRSVIDWDDVHVMPFIVGVNYPEDNKSVTVEGLSPDSDYYRGGKFSSFPPNEYGEIVGAVDSDGKLTGIDQYGNSTGIDERDERIRNTMFREQYVKALQVWDARVAQPDMWIVRREVLKAHDLLMTGGRMWWDKRQWLNRQT